MSITDSFNPVGKPLITPAAAYRKSPYSLDVCVINFSQKIMDALTDDGVVELLEAERIRCVACYFPIYRVRGTNIGVVRTTVGAPITATLTEEISYVYSCRKFVMFGSCGGLDSSIAPGKLIVPTHAYRDEGMSYHYAPPADYIEVRNHAFVASVLDSLGVGHVEGRTWTTDAFYRETDVLCRKRRAEGCIAVEMEVSAVQAVADFYGFEFYNFLYRADKIILFKFSNYFLKVAKAYKEIRGQDPKDNWYEFVEYGSTNKRAIAIQKHGFSRESAMYILRQGQKYIAADEPELRLHRSILECPNKGVQNDAYMIQYNILDLFVD